MINYCMLYCIVHSNRIEYNQIFNCRNLESMVYIKIKLKILTI